MQQNQVYINNGEASVFSESMAFGTIAPGETSKTIVVALNIPDVKGIANIKLGLTSIGNLNFSDETFGIDNNYVLINDYSPEGYFQGVNTDKLASNEYNVSIPNKDANSSNYVYLDINIPRNNIPQTSVLRYTWFFDFAE